MVKIFYIFSTQDIPEFFEDHLAEFMGIFRKFLDLDFAVASSLPGNILEHLKSSICDVVSLYSLQYDEEFVMLPQFVESVWNLLMGIGEDVKFDYVSLWFLCRRQRF